MRFFTAFRKKNSALALWVILVLVLMGGVMLPLTTHAATPEENCRAAGLTYDASLGRCSQPLHPLGNPVSAIAGGIYNDFVKGLFDFIAGHLVNIVTAVLAIAVSIISFIVSFFAVLTGLVMNEVMKWVVDVVPYTPLNTKLGPGNPITLGWNTTRNLADMALIFVLVWIAVSMILGIAKDWGRTILNFIGIALLINFTPVITGFFIDITNVVTRIFLSQEQNAWTLFIANNGTLTPLGTMIDALPTLISGSPLKGIGILVQALSLLVFTGASIVAFTTMTFLLLARVLALWLLVILSPLAFLLYILPETKQYFEKWWHNFWQWAIIAIPLGFFFWLAAQFKLGGNAICGIKGANWQILEALGTTYKGTDFGTIASNSLSTFSGSPLNEMCGSIMLLMALATLFVGFFISFSFSATGSKMIVAKGTQWGTAMGTRVAYGAGKLTGAGASAIGSGLGARYAASGFGSSGLGRGIAATAGRIPQGIAFAGKKGLQYGLPLTKKGLEQMSKAGGAVGATGAAMAKGVYTGSVTAIINASPIWGTAPLQVRISDASRGVVTRWAWEFGDKTQSTMQNPGGHTYVKRGNYTIKLTVTGADGSTSSANTVIRVNAAAAGGAAGGGAAPGGGAPGGGGPSPFGAPLPTPPSPAPGGGPKAGGRQTQAGGGLNAAPPASPLHPVGLQPAPAPQQGQAVQPQTLGGGAAGSMPSFPTNGTVDEIISWLRMIAFTEQGTRVALGDFIKKESEQKDIYRQLANDKEEFKRLAKRIPDIIQNASPQIRQRIYNVSTPAEAKQAMHADLSRGDFAEKTGNIPQEYIYSNAREIVRDIKDPGKLYDIDDGIRSNPQYSERVKAKFTYEMFNHLMMEPK